MLLNIIQYLPRFLILIGLLLGVGAAVMRIVRKEKLSARARGHVFFWGSVGFWSVTIGAFMILEKLLPS